MPHEISELTSANVFDIQPTEAPEDDVVNRAIGGIARPFKRQLTWLWTRGFRFLFVIDAVMLYGLMVAINTLRFGTEWPTYPRSHYLIGFGIASVIHLTVNYFAGLYEREPRLGYQPWLPRIATAMGIGIALDGLIAVLAGRYLMPRLNLGILLATGVAAITSARHLSRRLANLRRGPARLVLIGKEVDRRVAREHIEQHETTVVVVAESDDIQRLLELVELHHASDVLLLELSAFTQAFPEPLTALDNAGTGVHQRVSAAESLLGLRAVRQLGGIPFIRLRTHALAPHQLRLKRAFDLITILAFSPIIVAALAVLALYARTVAGRHILFQQERLGRGGHRFSIVKFRTMFHNAEPNGPQLSTAHDVRVIPAMRWMRATRLDELPQVWSVLRGHMSLVGPRPERPDLVHTFSQEVEGYQRRLQVPPGITGLAQIRGRYGTNPVHKLGYDLQYLVEWSIVLDIQILMKTVWVVVSRRG